MKNLLIALAALSSVSSFAAITEVNCKMVPQSYSDVATLSVKAVAGDHYVATFTHSTVVESQEAPNTKVDTSIVMKNLVCSFAKSNTSVFNCFEDIRDTMDDTSSLRTSLTLVPGLGEAIVLSVESASRNAPMATFKVNFRTSECSVK